MHQTTVRFSSELWGDLAAEATLLGVSVAQFIREAALARLAYSAGRRGEAGWQAALHLAQAELATREAGDLAAADGDRAAALSNSQRATPHSAALRRRLRESTQD